ncbi:hypothetical protein DFA_10969 [Cavenderia fasciculata]|uniref:Cysteine proteinase n=1 Tax=Cavenderia fasciculata TaxID=261658 RepID=F4QBX3_CACFS|nr:uncharacterized protein DFA_10969 [Cavenderia fasciculata]EGG14711.1 hypothetical protein DFA_10969 [Cavenderia fasciculata]|eukprot:XP_004351219.1 hypothetical protein DFA_10969 [Cavenderia fasciculata]
MTYVYDHLKSVRSKTIFCVTFLGGALGSKPTALFSHEQYTTEFKGWVGQFEKNYESHEFLNRFDIFKKNMDYIKTWNDKSVDHKLELNTLADLTDKEYQRLYLGTKVNGALRVGLNHADERDFGHIKSVFSNVKDNPNVDWRKQGAVSHVKNQGQCGSCWSFSSTGAIEGAHAIKTGEMISLSEQQLVDCSKRYGNNGCNGGLMTLAFDYVIDAGGLESEEAYPYTTTDTSACMFNSTNAVTSISDHQNIRAGNEKHLETVLRNVGPVSVAIDASPRSFRFYKSGIFYAPECSSSQLDHGVLAVGFGKGNPESNFENKVSFIHDDTKNNEYYIVKNSWGSDWGSNGFIYMSKNRKNNCGIATMATYPTI